MDIKSIKNELINLRKQIRHHNKKYYDDDSPEISDYEYDQLMLRLKSIESQYPELITKTSPTQFVGGNPKRSAGNIITHDVPMLSLQDVFSRDEVFNFVQSSIDKLGDVEFIVEEKIDGLSLALRYVNGQLQSAITRGDGVNGEDVTANALVIDDVIHNLIEPVDYFEVRGEVYMTRKNFELVNQRQELLQLKSFANPRNCAAGTLRQLDSRIVKERHLSMFIFNLQSSTKSFNSHTSAYDFMKANNIKVIHNYKVCHTAQEVWSAIEDIGASRGNLDYDIDGAVIKINSFAQRQILGATSKFPKWAIAYKYPPEEKETVLRKIELSVGRTGRITPTAVFDSISLCGTNVTRATLHNQDFINKLDIRVGDYITVYKSGEIIPRVKSVIKSKRQLDSVPFTFPELCPICNHHIEREMNTADFHCINPNCSAQIESHLINFASRNAMDIKGLGEVAIHNLIEHNFIHNIIDIFKLKNHRQELINQSIFGKEKSTDNVLNSIEESKSNDPVKLLIGLGIAGIGQAAARDLIKTFHSIDRIISATVEDLLNIKDLGAITVKHIRDFFDDESNLQMLNELKSLGLNFESNLEVNDDLNGKIFVVTGTLEHFKREEVKQMIEEHGGKVTNSISSKTNYLVIGENPGSKLQKAIELNIKTLSENELMEMLKCQQEM